MLHTPSASKPSAGVHVVPPHHLGQPVVMSVMCVKIPWVSVNLKTALKVVVVLNCLPQ